MRELQDLVALIRANTPLLVIETPDKARVIELFRQTLMHAWRALYRWSITEGLPHEDIDLSAVAAAADGFSGAEIEQVIVSAMYATHAARTGIDTHALVQAARETRPLSVMMAEQVQALRSWAQTRAVPAG